MPKTIVDLPKNIETHKMGNSVDRTGVRGKMTDGIIHEMLMSWNIYGTYYLPDQETRVYIVA